MDPHTGRGLRFAMVLGIGVGLMASAFMTAAFPQVQVMTNAEIMQRARALGMNRLTEMPGPDQGRPASAPGTLILLLVEDSAGLQDVAQMLKDAGAINDINSFLQRAHEKGVPSQIRGGPYTLTLGDTTDQIIDKLARP